jgi:hypothetical protein
MKPKTPPKPPAYTKHPLWKPAIARMEQGSAAMTVRNQIVRGAKVKQDMVKFAGITPRKTK